MIRLYTAHLLDGLNPTRLSSNSYGAADEVPLKMTMDVDEKESGWIELKKQKV